MIPYIAHGLYLGYRSNIGGRPDPASKGERAFETFVLPSLLTPLIVIGIGIISGNLYFRIKNEDLFLAAIYLVTLLPSYWLVWQGGWKRIRIRMGWLTELERERWLESV